MSMPSPSWAYDASISFLDPEDVMRAQFDAAGFLIREWTNYSDEIVARAKKMEGAPPTSWATILSSATTRRSGDVTWKSI